MKDRKTQAADLETAYRAAIRLLGRRAHSRRELVDKLRRREHSPESVAEVIRRCEAHRYLDDEAACEGYCRELMRKGQGPRAIRQRLAGRGFDGDLIERTMDAQCSREAVMTSARSLSARKARQLLQRHGDPRKVRPRLARFLTQRGFPTEVVLKAIDEALGAK